MNLLLLLLIAYFAFANAQTTGGTPNLQTASTRLVVSNIGTTPTTSSCSYSSTPNKNQQGGFTVSEQYSDLSSCQAYCSSNNWCLGFDFNPLVIPLQRCWFNNVTVPVLTDYTGVTNYRKVCNNNVGTPGTLGTPGTPGTQGTTPLVNANTPTSLLTTPKPIPTAPTAALPPGCSWGVQNSSNSPSGTYKAANTLLECMSYCLNTNNCKFGFDWTGAACWLSTVTTVNVNAAPGVTHYFLNCITNQTPTTTTASTGFAVSYPPCAFQLQVDTNSPEGQLLPGVSDIKECESNCLKNGCFFGYDYNTVNRQCWISKSNNLGKATGVYHYYLPCLATPTTILFVTTMSTTLTTALPTPCNILPILRAKSPYGNYQNGINTIQGCLNACLVTGCIYGFDFTESSACFISTRTDVIVNVTGVDHYFFPCLTQTTPMVPLTTSKMPTLTVITGVTTKPPAVATPCPIQAIFGANSPFGTYINGINTLTGCIYACLTDKNACNYGFDFTANSACFVSNSTVVYTKDVTGVDHYSFPCLVPTTLATQSTAPAIIPSTTTSTIAPMITTKAALATPCPVVQQYNTSSPNGQYVPGVFTLTECQNACIMSNCAFGFDFDTSNACYLSINSIIVNSSFSSHFYFPCKLTSTTTTTTTQPNLPTPCALAALPYYNTPAGLLQPGVNTQIDCQNACVKANACIYGFDMDYITNACYLSQSTTLNEANFNVTHYYFPCLGNLCTYAFIKSNNTQMFGGLANPATTESACREACIAQLTCIGLDFDSTSTSNKCFLLTVKGTIATANGVTHYDIVRTSVNCPTSTTPTANTCNPTFSISYGTQWYGGNVVSAATTEDACKEACIKQSSCIAFDLDNTTAPSLGCFLFTSKSSNSNSNNKVTHYDITRPTSNCSPGPPTTAPSCTANSFIKKIGIFWPGGIQNAATDEAGCISACIADPTCLGFDLNSNQCFLLKTASNDQANSAVNHYEIIRCPAASACSAISIKTGEYQMVGGIYFKDTTENDCRATCLAQSTCIGFDLDISKTPSPCFILSSKVALTPSKTINHTDIIRPSTNCASVTSPSPNACTPTFSISYGTQWFGGTQANTVTTEDACKSTCIKQSTCIAFDLDNTTAPSLGCFLFESKPPNSNSNNKVTHYDITRPTSNCSPAPCVPTFKISPNMNVIGGILNAATGEADCFKACVADSNCLGFDLNGNQCFLLYVSTTPQNNTGGVNHYDVFRTCTGGLPSSARSKCGFLPIRNKLTLDGIIQPSVTTLDECKAKCESTECLFGFDWDLNLKKCYLSTTQTTYTATNVDHYSCCAVTKFPNTSSALGTFNLAQTVGACFDACLETNSINCQLYGIDFSTSCYLSTNNPPTPGTPNVDHYSFSCPPQALALLNMKMDLSTKIPGSTRCTWIEYPNRNTMNGVLQGNARNLDECKALCERNLQGSCAYGFDFNQELSSGLQCYFSVSNSTGETQRISHYTCKLS